MDNIRLQSLHPVIRDQDQKIEGLRQMVTQARARHDGKMAEGAKANYDRTVQIRSLKHNFATSVHGEPAPGSIFTDQIAVLRDNDTSNVLHRSPSQFAKETSRRARADNVNRIIDLLV